MSTPPPVAPTGLPARALTARVLLLAGALALLAAILATTPSRALADFTGAVEPLTLADGHLTGKLVDSVTGDPVTDVCVQASPAAPGSFGGGGSAFVTDGTYDIAGLEDRDYLLSIFPCGSDYLMKSLPDPVTVSGGGTTAVPDVHVILGGAIHGRITGAGEPLAEACVRAGELDQGLSASTGADGTYTLHAVPAGTRTVVVTSCGAGNWLGASQPGVAVTAGHTAEAPTVDLARGGVLKGRVTGGGGALSGACVSALRGNDAPGFGMTDADGDYVINGLPTGDYEVYISACNGGNWIPQRVTRHVTAGGEPTVADATLAQGATISGHVTGGGAGLAAICVTVNGAPAAPPVGGDSTDAQGAYSVTGLPAGTYTLEFRSCGGGNWIGEWFDDQTDRQKATTITVAAGETKTADAVLERGATIAGKVTGPDGQPLAGICITASGQTASPGATPPFGFAQSGADGTYVVQGLTAASYTVSFSACAPTAGSWLSEYYDNATTPQDATAVKVDAGASVTSIDAQLERGATIIGRVTDATTHAGVSGVCITALPATSTSSQPGMFTGMPAFTQPDGTYRLTGVRAGSYKVRFADCAPHTGTDLGYAARFGRDKPTLAAADVIDVAAGDTVAGVDAALSPAGAISGHVTSGTQPAAFTCVVAETAAGDLITNTMTGPDGRYTLTGVPAGTVDVRFGSAACGIGTSGFEPRRVAGVTVTAGATTTAVDAQLSAAAAPETTITSGPANGSQTAATRASVSFASSKPGSTFLCALDGAEPTPCTSPRAIDGPLAPGPHTFSVMAVDADGNFDHTPATRSWTVAPAATSESTSGTLAAGGTVESGTTATEVVPVVAGVTTPTGGDVAITTQPAPTTTAPTGWSYFGRELQITAPPATGAAPLRLVFTIDASALPAGGPTDSVTVFRDGAPAADCTGAAGTAVPDPCVAQRETLAGGDLRITVLSTHASTWNLGRSTAPAGSGSGSGAGTSTGTGTTTTTPATPQPAGDSAAAGSPASSGTAAPTTTPSRTSSAPAATPAAPKTAAGCRVPALKGKTLAQARKLLAKAHCAVGKVSKKRNRKLKAGRVASQAKKAGASLPAGARINLVLSRR